MFKLFALLAISAAIAPYAQGHGMLLLPINRASRWRTNDTAPINYDDNGLFCGGREVQWTQNGGHCGLCGDDYADPTPRTYELGSMPFGEGVIVDTYRTGNEITAEVLITANHLGYFTFDVCNIDKHSGESEKCFQEIQLVQTNGERKYFVEERVGVYNILLKIPDDLICKHCVLQWTYTTGNSWGDCEGGKSEQGCGPQETFRTCSDISILP